MRLPLLLLTLTSLVTATFREQSIGAKGYVSCRGVRQPGTFIQLYDEDIWPFDSDDLMGSTTADGIGHFCVKGSSSEVTDIDPYILIEHNCGYEGLQEKTVFFYYLNADYIVEGNISRKIENLGEIELLTADAPVQHYEKKFYHHHHRKIQQAQSAKIRECIPLYVTYKDFFEKEVYGDGREQVHVLRQDSVEIETETSIRTDTDLIDRTVVHKIEEEIKEVEHREEEHIHELEDRLQREEMDRKLEEERLRELERQRQEDEKRRIEDQERLRIEEERRLEQERILEERRKLEAERAEEEKRREAERKKQEEEYERRMAEYHRQMEERRQEILRREQEKPQEVPRDLPVTDVDDVMDNLPEDDPCYRKKRYLPPSDPCYKRLHG